MNCLRTLFLFVITSLVATQACATPGYGAWVWQASGSSTTYATKGEAVAAMRASITNGDLLTEETPASPGSSGAATFSYSAPPTSAEIKTDWVYGPGGSATEAGAMAYREAQAPTSPYCPAASASPDGGWQFVAATRGITTAEDKDIIITTYTYGTIYTSDGTPVPTCTPQERQSAIYRSRTVGCPAPYNTWDTSLEKCTWTTKGSVTGSPLTPTCDKEGNPCSASNGDKSHAETDYQLGDFNFTRHYHSHGFNQNPAMSPGWYHSFQDRLLMPGSTPTGMIHSGGFSEKLTLVSTGVYRTVHSRAELRKTASGTWVLDHGNGPRDTFNATGRLIVREVRPGYALTLAYNAAGRLISVSNPFTSMILLGYDNAGRLQSLTSPAGHVTQYGYDAAGNLSLVTLPNGTTRIYHYEDARWPNAMTGITNENGTRYATYAYDDIGRGILTEHAGGSNRHTLNYFADRTEVGTPLGAARVYRFQMISGARKVTSIEETCQSCAGGKSTVTFTYDTQGNTTSRTNALGTKTTYAYNLARNLETSRTEAYGTQLARTVTTQWHATLRLPTQISEPGKVTSFTYDAQGNLLSRAVTASGETRTSTYTYNNYGQMLTEDGPRTDVNDITSYTYNAQGNLAGITNALGHSTLVTQYNSDGLPVTIQDANGIITSLVHDIRGRLLSSTRAGATHSFTYDGAGNVITSTDPAGVTQTYTYDGDNRLTRITDSQGNHIDYTLNLLGSRVSEQIVDSSNQLAYARSSLYDTLGRLQQVLNAAGQTRQSFTTDALGNILTSTDGLQHTTTSSYDALGRLAASINPANGTTSYGYDAQDNLTSVTDANNHVTSYSHNGFGERISETSPNTGTVTYTRDSAGNMASKTDARGVTTTFSYDAINRTTAINYPTSALNIAYSYDQGSNGIGRLTAMTDASGLTTYTYNALGHLITSNHAGRQTSYQYDTAGRLTQITYPSGHTAAYARNSVGKVTQVNVTLDTQTYPVASNIGYQPYGDVTALTFGNGLAWTRTIDTDGRLTQNTLPNVQSTNIGYDDADRITSLSDQLSPALSQAFQYDAADRLTQATGAYGVQQYAYDATGNRTSLTTNGNSTAYHYASNSQRLLNLTGAYADTLDYDANGNTVFQIGYPLTFDDRNRLTALNGVSFQYNGKGERVEKSVAGTSTRYVYNQQGQLLAETDSNNITLREYVWLGHWPIAVITPQPAQPSRIDYIHPDHLGTPRLVTNASQTIIWRWDSSPFGASDAQQDPDGDNQAFVLNLRFPGQYFDDETGLHYNYFRDYDPTLGRYIESDPIGLSGGVNTYSYVGGNPLSLIDPKGLETTMTCRPVTAFGRFGLSRPVHCAVIVWHWEEKCGNRVKVIDSQYSLAGGGTAPIDPNGPMTGPESGTYDNDQNAFLNPGERDSNYDISPPDGMSQQDFDAAVQQSGNDYSQGPYRFPPFGNNSNTAADNIIEGAGGVTPNIPGAWGQNYGE